jgi:hypothetical protein
MATTCWIVAPVRVNPLVQADQAGQFGRTCGDPTPRVGAAFPRRHDKDHVTHDQQGPAATHEPQGTPSTDPTTPSTVNLDKGTTAPEPAAPSTSSAPDAGYPVAGAPGQAPYPSDGYGPTGYGQPGYGQPVPAAQGTDGMSIAALVTGILGLAAIPIVLGILGLKRTKQNGTSGRGLAIAGIVLGGIAFVGYIVAGIAIAIGSAALVDSLEESGALASLETTAPEVVESEPADLAEPADPSQDELPAGATPLKDIAPLTVGAFTTAGLTDEPTITAAGALEAYTASYTDGTSTVETVLANWSGNDEATTFATAQTAAFAPESLVDQGTFDEVAGQYWVYDVDGVTSAVIATNETATLTFTGPAEAVYTLYNEFPL